MNVAPRVKMYSIDNCIFPFYDVESAVSAALQRNIPVDKMLEVIEGTFEDEITCVDPINRRMLAVKVSLSGRLDLVDYSIRSTSFVA